MSIKDIPHKLTQAREIDRHCLLCGADSHRYRLNPRLKEEEVLRFEQEHGIELPTGYRESITLAGDGGAGPRCEISPLLDAKIKAPLKALFPFVEAVNPFDDSYDDDEELYDERHAWCYSGCLLIATKDFPTIMLIVTGSERGNTWDDYSWEDRGFEPGPDFVAWYESWLNDLLGNPRLRQDLELQWARATCRGFPHQCPECFGTNIRSHESLLEYDTLVGSTWEMSPSRSVRHTCCDCGHSIEQIS